MKGCVVVCLDAFRYDYLNARDTPFLYRLANEGVFGRLQTVLGFTGISATAFSGAYPETHGVWTTFLYRPESSPFRWIDPFASVFSPLDCSPFGKKLSRTGISVVTNILRYLCGCTFFEKVHEIPLRYAKFFDFSLKKAFCEKDSLDRVPTIFDVSRENGIDFLFVDYPIFHINGETHIKLLPRYSDAAVYQRFLKLLGSKPEFSYLHLWDLDKISHKEGTRSKKRVKKVKELDVLVETLFRTLRKRFEDTSILIFSDHGMVDVNRSLNVIANLHDNDLNENDGFLSFVGATLARFWFKKEKAREKVSEALESLDGGHILTEADLRKYRIRFFHRKYGDLLFLADPGVVITPNYFQGGRIFKAMHGYDPDYPDQHGIFIFNNSRIKATRFERIKIVDVFPTLLETLRLPKPPLGTYEGKSVFTRLEERK